MTGYCWSTPKCRNSCVQHASLKAKKLRKPSQEEVLLELCSRLTNSIWPFWATYWLTGHYLALPSLSRLWVEAEFGYFGWVFKDLWYTALVMEKGRRPSKAESAPKQPRKPDQSQHRKLSDKRPETKRLPWWEFFDTILRKYNSEPEDPQQPIPPKSQS